jgi:hypothetical protein
VTRHVRLPSRTTDESGRPRRVGVEIEFGELPVEEAARIVAGTFGGTVTPRSDYERTVRDTSLGDFVVEIDFELLKKLGAERADRETEPAWWEKLPEELLAAVSGEFVPVEIACPPIPLPSLDALELLVRALGAAGARGTGAMPHYAFGLHFNVEPPSLAIDELLAYVRAFAILEPWLRERTRVDPTRTALPFVRPWPETYVLRILDDGYAPGSAAFVADYVHDNASRNRALDLLPILATIDAARIERAVERPVAARPALHYRLANSRIGEPGWRIRDEWEPWLAVETLAADRSRIRSLAARLRRRIERGEPESEWIEELDAWAP